MSKKKWRTRKRGTPAQIGTRFPVSEHRDKRDLPTGMKEVVSLSRRERIKRKLDLLLFKLRQMQKEAENLLIEQGFIPDEKKLEMNKLMQEIEDIHLGFGGIYVEKSEAEEGEEEET